MSADNIFPPGNESQNDSAANKAHFPIEMPLPNWPLKGVVNKMVKGSPKINAKGLKIRKTVASVVPPTNHKKEKP